MRHVDFTRRQAYRLGCVVAGLCFVWTAQAAFAEVVAEPNAVQFDSYDQSANIKLMRDGKPLSAADIKGWGLYASGHDYNFMLTYKKADGMLTIAPSDKIEVGSYHLVIQTTAGPVIVKVLAPMSSLPDVLQKEADKRGISIMELKKQLGMSTEGHPSEIDVALAPTYYEGQSFTVSMPQEPGKVYSWVMNGHVITEGPDANSVTYTFVEPGDYVLDYIERQGDRVVATTTARTKVAATQPVQTRVTPNTAVTFRGPEGYTQYVWKVDGTEVAKQKDLVHTFSKPGTYALECIASGKDPDGGYFRVRYNVLAGAKTAP